MCIWREWNWCVIDTYTPVFIAVLVTIAKKENKCPPTDGWIRNGDCTMGWYPAIKKKWSPIIHERIEGTPDHYVKWNMQGMERQEPYDLTQVESKERKKWSHLIKVESTMVAIKGWRYREWMDRKRLTSESQGTRWEQEVSVFTKSRWA